MTASQTLAADYINLMTTISKWIAITTTGFQAFLFFLRLKKRCHLLELYIRFFQTPHPPQTHIFFKRNKALLSYKKCILVR